MPNSGIKLEERKAGSAVVGTFTAPPIVRNIKDFSPYLSDGELQRSTMSDFMDCTTMSAIQAIQTQINADIAMGKYSQEALDYFQNAGYMENGKFHASARYDAVVNGTGLDGQYMSVAGDYLSNFAKGYGLLPYKDMPMTPNMTWEEYYAQPTQEQILKAKKIYQYLEIEKMAWVNVKDIAKACLNSPVQIATSVCPGWGTDSPVKTCGGAMEHCTIVYGVNDDGSYKILDHYVPFLKTLAPSYHIFSASQYVVRPALPPTLWNKLLALVTNKLI